MQQRKLSKRRIARTRKENAAVGATFAVSAIPLAGIGTLIFPGVGTVAGLLCAFTVATIKSRRYAHGTS